VFRALARSEEVLIPARNVELEGTLAAPRDARAMVIFAHGSGSSHRSPRNNYVAGVLHEAGIGTLLTDLLSPKTDGDARFDIGLLTNRLMTVTEWLVAQPSAQPLSIGYFGASTGAAAALCAASALDHLIDAVVSRGGRPDLADRDSLSHVKAPTLLIVGGLDDAVIEFNETAYALLQCEKDLVIVPGATHLFEEPGTLQEVARLAADWFRRHLGDARSDQAGR